MIAPIDVAAVMNDFDASSEPSALRVSAIAFSASAGAPSATALLNRWNAPCSDSDEIPMSPATSCQRDAASTPIPVASANFPALIAASWNAETALTPNATSAAPPEIASAPALLFRVANPDEAPAWNLATAPSASLMDVRKFRIDVTALSAVTSRITWILFENPATDAPLRTSGLTSAAVTDSDRFAQWLYTGGIASLLVALIGGLLLYVNRDDELATRLLIVLPAIGPLIVAGCVLLAAGAIVEVLGKR